MGSSISWFFGTILVTLAITYWAARRSTGRESLYAASGSIGAYQNGLAVSGDYLSAGTLLGIVGLYFMVGVDVSLYFIAPMAGLCLALALIVGPLRRFGRFTLGDVVEARLKDPSMRAVLGACTIAISLINLVAQLVGAGWLISIVFDLAFETAVVVVGTLMAIYVAFGGMLAATWVQIIKACILISAVVLLAVLSINHAGSMGALYERAAAVKAEAQSLFTFGALELGLFSSISLALASVLGFMGMPHLLIRFFTTPDEKTAKKSMVVATTLIGFTMGLVFLVVSPAGVAFIAGSEEFRDPQGGIIGGSNMITLHLARTLGGELFFGIMSAVAFSTILAVVAGLTVAIASATAHDVVGTWMRGRQLSEKAEVRFFRLAALVTAAVAVLLAMAFKHENLTFLIVMGSSIAASTTFPLLALAIYWRGLTAKGAIWGGVVGLVSSVGLILCSPAFWVKVLGFEEALFPSDYPALISVPLAFAAAWAGSRLTGAPAARTAGAPSKII